jgi:hypothetical protein
LFSVFFGQDIPKEFIAEPIFVNSFCGTIALGSVHVIGSFMFLLKGKNFDKENDVSVSVEFS